MIFAFPVFISIAGIALAFWWGGATAAIITALLAVMEISLSFGNTVS